MTGDGLIRRITDAPAAAGGLGVQPGTSSAVVIASTVIIFGPSGTPTGLFVYKPGTRPGPGNPPVAWVTENATDPYGNAVPDPVIGTQDPTTGSARLNGANVLLTYTPGGAGVAPAALSQVPAGVLALQSGGTSLADGQGVLNVFSVAAGLLGAPGAVFNTGQYLYGADPASGAPTSWAGMTLLNSWANNASFGAARYRPLGSPPNSIEVTGALSAAAATNAIFWQIPAIYQRPNSAGGRPCHTNTGNSAATSVAGIRWDTLGNLSVASNAALPNGATYFFGFTIPLDA